MSENDNDNDIIKVAIEKGVFNISDIDKFAIAKLINIKQDFTLSLSNLDYTDAYNQLRDLAFNIKQILEKYLDAEALKDFSKIEIKGTGYNFYDLYNAIPYAKNTEEIRLLWDYINQIFDKFLKNILKVALPTEKTNIKKKVINSLFALIPDRFKKSLADSILNDFEVWRQKNNLNKSLLNFLSFNIAKMQNYDLDAHILIIGQARSGKSTLSLRFLERIYSIKHDIPISDIDNFIVNRDFFNKNMIYNPNQKLDLVKQNFKDVIITDEAFLVADKRESMTGTNIKYTKLLNVFANRNNIVFTNMQDFTELDARIRKKANLIILITQRGLAYSYLQSVNLPIVKQPSIFEFFEENPYFLYSKPETIDWTLRHKIRGFIGIIKWQPFDNNNPMWKAYNEAKLKYQSDLDLSSNETKEIKSQAPQQAQPKQIDNDIIEAYGIEVYNEYKKFKNNLNKTNITYNTNIDNKKENETPPIDKFTYRCSYCGLTLYVAKNETPPQFCPHCRRRSLKLIAKPIE
jgi:GTPase SAR1 family protein/DNA-directed RNA polymerase subunit RPC12/RpoP